MLWRSRFSTKPPPAVVRCLSNLSGDRAKSLQRSRTSYPRQGTNLTQSDSCGASSSRDRLPCSADVLPKMGRLWGGQWYWGFYSREVVKGVTEGDESEVLVAQVQPAAGRRGRRGGFSGNLPLHPWLSLMPLCWRTHQSLSQFTAIHQQQQRDRLADGSRKRGVVSWCHLKLNVWTMGNLFEEENHPTLIYCVLLLFSRAIERNWIK